MRKECLPQFNQRRFYEGSGESKKESICETETGKLHNFTLFKITVLYTCTSKQLTIVLARALLKEIHVVFLTVKSCEM